MAFDETVVLGGVECEYDPRSRVAEVYCSRCSKRNEVEVAFEDGAPAYPGFICTECGSFNSPEC